MALAAEAVEAVSAFIYCSGRVKSNLRGASGVEWLLAAAAMGARPSREVLPQVLRGLRIADAATGDNLITQIASLQLEAQSEDCTRLRQRRRC